MEIHKILVPTDGSDHAEKGASYALDLAKLVGAAVVVMHAYSSPIILRKRGAIMAEELKNSLLEEAEELVNESAGKFQAAGVSVSAMLVEGSPVEAILLAIGSEKPDLIVMGSRGAGGMPGLGMGSVAERTVRHSSVPVLVVK